VQLHINPVRKISLAETNKNISMLTVPHHTTKKTQKKQKKAQPYHIGPKPFSDSYLAKEYSRFRFTKRLSPFLLSAMLLPFFAMYAMIAGIHIVNNPWLQLFILTGIEVYLLFFDFALWNYFEGKKIARIWVIELVCETTLIYCLL
jgi:hypothetical protein